MLMLKLQHKDSLLIILLLLIKYSVCVKSSVTHTVFYFHCLACQYRYFTASLKDSDSIATFKS